jgi:ribose transport system permease protein
MQANKIFNNLVGKVRSKNLGQLTGVLGALVLIFVVSCFISENFLTEYNLTIMARDLAFIGIVAIAQGFLLLLGDIDLSIGAVAGLCGVVTAKLLVDVNLNPILSMGLGLLVGCMLGWVNGFLTTFFKLNPLVLTIGSSTAFTGLNLAITRGRTITGLPEGITFLGAGSLLGIPVPIIFMFIIFGIALFLTTKTVFGRQLYAIGNNREAAKIVGIKENRVRIIAFMISGAFSGLAGILMSFRLISAQTSIGATWVMPSIAAAVIGGIATTGGIGNIAGALLGGAIMGVIGNIIVLGGVDAYWQQVFDGVIVVLAIIIDSLSRSIRTKKA